MRTFKINFCLLLMVMTATCLHAQEDKDQTFTVNGETFTMKYVPGGTLNYNGVTAQVKSFYMGETEVTQALWVAVMGNNPSWFQGAHLDFHWGKENSKTRPVEQVSWNDCQVFVQKLQELTGKEFRLPTAHEWGYAALGGREGKKCTYAGSNDPDAVAWYEHNSGWSEITKEVGLALRTQQVKQKEPNELGIYDLSGNVAEWVQDRNEDYVVALGGHFHDYQKKIQVWATGLPVHRTTSTHSEVGLRVVYSGTTEE